MIIYHLALAVILFLTALFQTAFIPAFTEFAPNLLLIIVLALCWTDRREEALWTAFLGGLFFDFLTVRPIGIHSLLLIAVVFGVSLIQRITDNLLSRFLTAFLIALGWHFYPGFFLSERTIILAGLDAIFFVALFPVLTAFFKRLFWEEDLQLSFRDKLR